MMLSTKNAGPDDFPVYDMNFKYVGHLSGALTAIDALRKARDHYGVISPVVGLTRTQEELAQRVKEPAS